MWLIFSKFRHLKIGCARASSFFRSSQQKRDEKQARRRSATTAKRSLISSAIVRHASAKPRKKWLKWSLRSSNVRNFSQICLLSCYLASVIVVEWLRMYKELCKLLLSLERFVILGLWRLRLFTHQVSRRASKVRMENKLDVRILRF